MRQLLTFVILATLLATACKKKNDNATPTLTYSQALDSLGIQVGQRYTFSTTAPYDTLVFNADGWVNERVISSSGYRNISFSIGVKAKYQEAALHNGQSLSITLYPSSDTFNNTTRGWYSTISFNYFNIGLVHVMNEDLKTDSTVQFTSNGAYITLHKF